MKKNFILPFLLLLCFVSFLAIGQERIIQSWESLGQVTVDAKSEQAEIVPSASESDKYTSLKLKVKHGGINLRFCVVFYNNGKTQEVEMPVVIPQGGESRVIELTEKNNPVTRFVIKYDIKNRGSNQAIVELLGKK